MSSGEVIIPTQLKHCQFNRVRFKEKRAFEQEWQKKPYLYEEIQEHFPKENYGVICNNGLRVLDDDTDDKRLIGMFTQIFGKTFRVRDHLYFRFDNNYDKKIILMNDDEHLGEIQGKNTYVVGPGSTHPSGEIYQVVDDEEIITISLEEFKEYFGEFMNKSSGSRAKADTTEFDEEFVQGIIPQWKEGNRQELAMSLAGYLRKELRYGFNHTLEVVKRICELTDDKDYEERAAAVQATYLKDEEEVKGYQGLKALNVQLDKPDEEKDKIIWSDNFNTWKTAKAKSYAESKTRGELVFYAHKKDTIKGKPSIYDNTKRTILNLITTGEKTDSKTGEIKQSFKFIDEHYDKRFDGTIKESLSKAYWVYQVVDSDGNEYLVLMDYKNPSSEVQYFYGMNVEIENSNEISTEFKAKGKKNLFFCHSSKPTIQPLPKEDIIPFTEEFIRVNEGFNKGDIFRDFFFDILFTHEDGNIYRQPHDYMLMRHAQMLSGKVNGYPLSTLSLGVAGCSKTMEVESIDHIFGEGVLEAGNSTPKALVPSFKEKPASPGHIMSCNRIALIDELMKMIDNQIMTNGSTSEVKNQLSQLNYLLEHKKRSVGSGNNNSFTGQCTAKTIMVGNPAGKMNYLSEHIKVLDESTLSRFFIWIKGFEHKKFVQSNKIVKSPNTYTTYIPSAYETYVCIEKVFGDFIYEYYLTIYDSCQAFTVEVDYEKVEKVYKDVLTLIPHDLKNVWAARGRHHTELIIDGITKWRRIFEQQRDDFVAREEDYTIAERILVQMAESWSFGLQDMY